jgi:leucyl aminopeptidase
VQAQDFLYGRFQALGWQDLHLHDYDAYADNVVAVLPGLVDPDEIWVLGAHYDSINSFNADPTAPAPGADDNGTGTSGVLEVGRILAESGVRFEATIVLIGFAREENGRIGSKAWVDDAIANGDDIRGAVVMDILGYLEPGTDLDISFGPADIDPLVSEDLTNAADLVVETYLPDFVRDIAETCG